MFFGESLCFFFYLAHKFNKKSNLNDEEEIFENKNRNLPKIRPYQLAIPAIFDLISGFLSNYGLSMMTGSLYQLFKGTLVFFTALFSVILLKKKLYVHNYLGLIFVISGLSINGFSSVIYAPKISEECPDSIKNNSIFGILLVIISQLFSALQYIIEEKLMKKYDVHPLKAVGWEGVWGVSLCIVILTIFQFVNCGSSEPIIRLICVQDDSGEWFLENTLFAIRQIADNSLLFVFVLFYICSTTLYNFIGLAVTKYESSTSRVTIDSLKTIVIWIFFLMPFNNECTRESFSYLQLIGFVLLIIGSGIYSEVVRIPYLKNNDDKEQNINLRESLNEI